MRGGLLAVAATAALLLSACVTTPAPVADPVGINTAWSLRQQQLAANTGFDATGRVAVKGGGLSGALRWQQEGETFKLRIAGPFGAGALSMEGTPALVSIKGKEIDLTTDEPGRVLAERTGWRLPLDALRWWVLGLPAPEPEASVLLDEHGRATQITQGGWVLQFEDYHNDPALPTRIVAVQGAWSATLVLQELTLKP